MPNSDQNKYKFNLLYRLAAVAALTTVFVTLLQIILGILWPPPSFAPTTESAVRILEMAQLNPVLTFLKLDGLMILDYLLLIMVYLALYQSLKHSNPSLMLLATALAFIAVTLYIMTNPAATMIVLAMNYSPSGGANSGIVTAAQTILANFQGTAFLVHYVIMGVSGILVGLTMLRSNTFSRSTAIAGLTQGTMMLVPVTFGMVGLLIALGSLIPFIIWFILIAIQLNRMASAGDAKTLSTPID
ncbi:MAG: DUF4386 domain-containing protein [Candidatus Marinimicrobia bacterium]|nr:DUF4386 domain-containing protein [Candidatus Neomarinimicrobiota bacterium]MCF7850940.1 DUF4386 domain-containing protein [Candidatus Neomarinimicrobiota bacterium]